MESESEHVSWFGNLCQKLDHTFSLVANVTDGQNSIKHLHNQLVKASEPLIELCSEVLEDAFCSSRRIVGFLEETSVTAHPLQGENTNLLSSEMSNGSNSDGKWFESGYDLFAPDLVDEMFPDLPYEESANTKKRLSEENVCGDESHVFDNPSSSSSLDSVEVAELNKFLNGSRRYLWLKEESICSSRYGAPKHFLPCEPQNEQVELGRAEILSNSGSPKHFLPCEPQNEQLVQLGHAEICSNLDPMINSETQNELVQLESAEILYNSGSILSSECETENELVELEHTETLPTSDSKGSSCVDKDEDAIKATELDNCWELDESLVIMDGNECFSECDTEAEYQSLKKKYKPSGKKFVKKTTRGSQIKWLVAGKSDILDEEDWYVSDWEII